MSGENFIRLLAVVLMTLTVTITQMSATEIVLAADGQARAAIVRPSGKLTSSEYIAVRDLAGYLGRISGATFQTVPDGRQPAGKACIYVGRAAAKRLGVDAGALEKDEWIVRTKGGNLYLTGGRWFGVEYAVNHFLEDVLGVHWWTPWDETVPSIATLKIGRLDLRGKPAFPHSRRHDGKHFERYTFNSRNGATRDVFVDAEGNFSWADSPHGLGIAHNLPGMVSWKQYGKKHPDWFARKNGEVIRVGGNKLIGHCFTNPEVAKVLAEKIRETIREKTQEVTDGRYIHPVPFSYHLSAGDHGPPCQCPPCNKLSRAQGSSAGPLIRMLSVLGDDIRREYPWAMVSTIAYEFSRKPPKTVRAGQGVMVRLCTEIMNIAAPLEHPSNRAARKELLGWQKQAETLGIWSYESDFAPHRGLGGYGVTWDLPIPNVHLIAGRYRYWRKHGVVSVFQQTLGMDDIQGDMRPLKIWLSLKLMEDPDRDWRTLLRTFTDGFYGPAGPHVRRYLDALHEASRKHPSVIRFFAGIGRYKYLTLDFLTRANALFDKARAAVADNAVLSRRVRRARIGVDRSVMFFWPKLVAQWVKRGHSPETMSLDFDVAVRRYEKTFREQLAKRALPKSKWPHKKYGQIWAHFRNTNKSRLSKVLAAVRNNRYIPTPVPKRFAGQSIFDYPVGGAQYKFQEDEWMALVDDPQAAGGKAIRVRGEGLKLPVACGAAGRGLARKLSIGPADVPGPGYHWYRVGKVSFNYGAGAYVFDPNTVRSYAFEYGLREVWVSLKFDGPAFAFGSKDGPNTAWLERMILLEPKRGNVRGVLSLPRTWTVFGPLDRKDPTPPVEVLRTVSGKLVVGDKTLSPQILTARKGKLDLASLLGGSIAGRTAYVFIPFRLARGQTLTFGAGADWWFQAWLDGRPLMSTLESGNGAWPPAPGDHVKTLRVAKGAHVLAVRFLSGTGSSVLAVAGPSGLRRRGKP